MICGFGMGTDGAVPRECKERCAQWVGTSKGKGQCVFVLIPKKLQYIGDMLSAIDDKLEPITEFLSASAASTIEPEEDK